MVCFPKRNLLTAMIPLHRKAVHMKKLAPHACLCPLADGLRIGYFPKAIKLELWNKQRPLL